MIIRRNKLNKYFGESFSTPEGKFNSNYILHFQTFSPSLSPDVTIDPIGPCTTFVKFLVGLCKYDQKEIFQRAKNTQHNVWSLNRMNGAEYEMGYFESMLVRTTLRSDLTSGTIDLSVKMPSFAAKKGITATEVPATLYYIAPKPLESATRDMLTRVAAGKELHEASPASARADGIISHRGIGVVMGTLYKAQIEAGQTVDNPTVGGGEIYQSVFWFNDEKMFRKACTYLDVKAPKLPAKATTPAAPKP